MDADFRRNETSESRDEAALVRYIIAVEKALGRNINPLSAVAEDCQYALERRVSPATCAVEILAAETES